MLRGQIVKIISNLYTVKVENQYYECRARGKFRFDKITPLVGDIVTINVDEKSIEEIHDRKNYLNRPQISNVDIALIVTSVKEPDLSLYLLDKLILVIREKNIEPVICVSKIDLVKNKSEYKKIFSYYEKIGVKVFYNNKLPKLKKYLKNKLVVLTGQTGAGKSSLLNRLDKSLNLDTNPISYSLGRGVHTTRHTEIHEIGHISFADTPGFSSLNLDDITKDNIKVGFPEFLSYNCPFNDCIHVDEKECMVKTAVLNNKILKSRYDNYVSFIREIK